MIVTESLSFDYPGKRALENVSINIAPHTVTALVGPNGAGKTTLLRALAALESPTEGKILIDGWDTDRFPRNVHAICKLLPDFFGLYDDLTVTQNCEYFSWAHGLGRVSSTKEQVETAIQSLELTQYRHVPAGKLSRGLRQRLAIALCIIHKPKILFLDEPAAGLDPEARFHLSKLIVSLKNEGMTLIVSSHILSELEDYSTHMLVMKEGKVIEFCPLDNTQRMQDIYLKITQPIKTKE